MPNYVVESYLANTPTAVAEARERARSAEDGEVRPLPADDVPSRRRDDPPRLRGDVAGGPAPSGGTGRPCNAVGSSKEKMRCERGAQRAATRGGGMSGRILYT